MMVAATEPTDKHKPHTLMPAQFPSTSLNFLSKLREAGQDASWQVSWKRFLELYHEPIEAIARGC
jgi:hypothetical protein